MVAALLKLLKFYFNILSSLFMFASISGQLTVFLPIWYKYFIPLIPVNILDREPLAWGPFSEHQSGSVSGWRHCLLYHFPSSYRGDVTALHVKQERPTLLVVYDVLAYGVYGPVQVPHFIFGRLCSLNALLNSYWVLKYVNKERV